MLIGLVNVALKFRQKYFRMTGEPMTSTRLTPGTNHIGCSQIGGSKGPSLLSEQLPLPPCARGPSSCARCYENDLGGCGSTVDPRSAEGLNRGCVVAPPGPGSGCAGSWKRNPPSSSWARTTSTRRAISSRRSAATMKTNALAVANKQVDFATNNTENMAKIEKNFPDKFARDQGHLEVAADPLRPDRLAQGPRRRRQGQDQGLLPDLWRQRPDAAEGEGGAGRPAVGAVQGVQRRPAGPDPHPRACSRTASAIETDTTLSDSRQAARSWQRSTPSSTRRPVEESRRHQLIHPPGRRLHRWLGALFLSGASVPMAQVLDTRDTAGLYPAALDCGRSLGHCAALRRCGFAILAWSYQRRRHPAAGPDRGSGQHGHLSPEFFPPDFARVALLPRGDGGHAPDRDLGHGAGDHLRRAASA